MASAAQDMQPSAGIDYSQIQRTVAQLPAPVIERQAADRFAAEDLTDIERVALPLDLAVVAHAADLGIIRIVRLPQSPAVAAR